MKKVSVVIPAYNCEKTITRCLTSMVHQTLEDIEIIVVNDASTDGTLDIMRRCESQFPDKVKVVNCTVNGGCGGARSAGLDAATGEYIGMVDADDYVTTNMFELLYNRAKETGADVVDSGFYSESTDTARLLTGDDMVGILDDEKRSKLIASAGFLVTKIFKNELYNDPPVRMRKNVSALEDAEILIYLILKAKHVETVKEVLYNYCDTSGSNTKVMDLDKYYRAIYEAMERTHSLNHVLPTYEGSKEAVEFMIANMYSYGINRCLYDNISRLGADISNVRKYFENLPDKEKGYLSNLAALRKKVITIDYRNNPELIKRISPLDVAIMEECDRIYG